MLILVLVSVFFTKGTVTYLMFFSTFAPERETNSKIQGSFIAYITAKLQLHNHIKGRWLTML